MGELGNTETFLYFAYGGNLLTFRIHMHNPTAQFISIARLDNYRIDFLKYSSFWGGPTATTVPTANGHVWGVIWRIHKDDMIRLDEQKGVEIKKYYIKYVTVQTPHMGDFICRSYIQKINPLPRGDNDEIPVEQWPSWTYKEVLILGAQEHGIPDYYIKQLRKLKHNGEEGAFRTICLLNRYAYDKPCDTCRVPGRIARKRLKMNLNKLKEFEPKKNTFLYFAYGSNLLKKLVHLNIPSAQFLGAGRLDEHQLEFVTYSEKWQGCLATIVPKDSEHVWGAIWRINDSDKEGLPQLEENIIRYIPRMVDVFITQGLKVECRTYQQSVRPILMERGEPLPYERRPSKTYYDCIIQGATECNLPKYYIELIKKITHNEMEALPDWKEKLFGQT